MSHILRMATVIATLAFGATVTQAHPINYQHHHLRAGYAGQVYSRASRDLWPWNVPGRSFAGAPQFNNRQMKGYGCLAHPDYGLYTPHFC